MRIVVFVVPLTFAPQVLIVTYMCFDDLVMFLVFGVEIVRRAWYGALTMRDAFFFE